MNKTIYRIKCFLIATFFLVLILFAIIFIFTMHDLFTNYNFDLSYKGLITIDEKLKSCKIYFGALLPIVTLLAAVNRWEIAQKNTDYQEIKVKYDALMEAMNKTAYNNSLSNIIRPYAYRIISDIYFKYQNHSINNAKDMETAFTDHIACFINDFEEKTCLNIYAKKLFYVKDKNNKIKKFSYSFNSFKIVSEYLLLPAIEYKFEFLADLEKLYFSKVMKIAEKFEIISENEAAKLIRESK